MDLVSYNQRMNSQHNNGRIRWSGLRSWALGLAASNGELVGDQFSEAAWRMGTDWPSEYSESWSSHEDYSASWRVGLGESI